MTDLSKLLARGPWAADCVTSSWRSELYQPSIELSQEADRALTQLRERGSPSHDGLSARLCDFSTTDNGLQLELEPIRWALRLAPDDASQSMAALCVVRDSEGRWLAGRRAPWVASWAGRWTLGAGGAVDRDESPVMTLQRELMEEWSLQADRLRVEALLQLPQNLVMVIGLATLKPNTSVQMDHEHDQFAWWPKDPRDWPREADEPLRRTAAMILENPFPE